MKRTLILLVALLSLCPATHQAETERLNILFCFADDWGRYAGAYAALESKPSPNQVVKTPNIDRVAREGVLFRNAFVNAPSCTPCRSALLTGRYFFNTGRGAILHGAEWDASIPSFPLLLRDAGYHIGKTSKVWSPGQPVDAPFGGQQYAYEKAGRRFNDFSENVTKMMQEGSTLDAARQTLLDEVRGNFDAFLAARKSGQPWLYWFGPTTVHRKWIKGSGKKLWGIDPDALKSKLPAFLPDVPEVREDFADYLGEAQAYDAYIGELLKRLEESGELNRTLIVISGDHGAPGFPGGKCNLYDFGVGVSLIARWPSGKAGRVVNDFVNLMDLERAMKERTFRTDLYYRLGLVLRLPPLRERPEDIPQLAQHFARHFNKDAVITPEAMEALFYKLQGFNFLFFEQEIMWPAMQRFAETSRSRENISRLPLRILSVLGVSAVKCASGVCSF